MKLLKQDISWKRTQTATFPDEASFQEFDTFLALQHLGIHAEEAVELSFSDRDQVLEGLNRGRPLGKVLSERKGWTLLEPFLTVMGLETARKTIESLSFSRKIWKHAGHWQLLYPILLLVGVLAMVIFFDSSVVPMMGEFMEGDSASLLIRVFRSVFTLLLLLFAILIWILCTGLQGNRQEGVFYRSGFVRRSHSLFLAECLKALLAVHIPTSSLFEILHSLPVCRLTRMQIGKIEERILNGFSWQEALEACPVIDPILLRHIQLGLNTDDLTGLLTLYTEQTRKKQELQIRRMCRWLTMTAYVSVGLLAVLVYQILLAPMNMLYTV